MAFVVSNSRPAALTVSPQPALLSSQWLHSVLGAQVPTTERYVTHGIGGGHINKDTGGIDFQRPRAYEPGKEDQPFEEKVVEVLITHPCRSADIALVVGANCKRWIIANENMHAGDIIKTSELLDDRYSNLHGNSGTQSNVDHQQNRDHWQPVAIAGLASAFKRLVQRKVLGRTQD
ncbi:39S ribosomal protein L2, mitochondrial [Lates japonicus]|uniref:39S ribosomal protein L2, mitochondrial n=1 Tax=Lates japonicus TaxID=270547 RepID=A0AAD3MMB3_LATJO|nr:39S ribosomal protein L2, mitochondrial [Lates japonicus]